MPRLTQLLASSLLAGLCCTHAAAQPHIRQLYPLLPYVFFDSGNAVVPDRYAVLQSAQDAGAFTEANLPSNTIAIHYDILNIIGSRMQRFADTKIEIVGSNSQQPSIGEETGVSKQRGEAVRDYLVRVWNIDSGRITMLKPRNFPEFPSCAKDPLGIVENRRAEIRTTDVELIRPVIMPDPGSPPDSPDSTFAIYNLILFKFDSPEMGPINERILKETVIPGLRKGTRVQVVGYTDVVGLEDRNLKLSSDRATAVVKTIKRLAPPGIIASITGIGTGETAPLYTNDLPEGRFYNRSVQVIVTTPVR